MEGTKCRIQVEDHEGVEVYGPPQISAYRPDPGIEAETGDAHIGHSKPPFIPYPFQTVLG
jgi:hypothetical protein